MERWLSKEIELSRRHEELVMRREALLRGTETYFDAQEARSASFIVDYGKAMERNHLLMKDLNECISELKHDVSDPGTPKFVTLKNNYWTMVRNVFPVWYEELKEYEKRRGVSNSGWSQTPKDQRFLHLRNVSGQNISANPAEVASQNRPARNDGTDEVDETTLVSVPPLDLDFSATDELTMRSALTPKPSSSKSKSSKKVHYDEESLRSTGRSKSAPPDMDNKGRSKSVSPKRNDSKDNRSRKN